jgi:hypothetical protein
LRSEEEEEEDEKALQEVKGLCWFSLAAVDSIKRLYVLCVYESVYVMCIKVRDMECVSC